jgi:hypothetical protein
MEVGYQIITYSQLRDGYKPKNDKYGIASYEFEARKKTFLSNPNLHDFSKAYLYVATVDDVIVGKESYFPTLMKMGNENRTVISGSDLSVQSDFRHLAIGADIILFSTFNEENSNKLFAGISSMALPLYKKIGYNIFSLPTFLLRRNCRVFLQRFGIKGAWLKVFSNIFNPIFKIKEILFCKTKELNKKFTIKKLQEVPKWIDNIVLNDGHKFMEVHDSSWLQWNLDTCFDDDKRNRQGFYAIYKSDKPVGFFMTKIRVTNKQRNVLSGTVVEWGSANESVLGELDINKLALKSFTKDVSYVTIGTLDDNVVKHLKKFGFFRVGDEHVVYMDMDKENNVDAKVASLWRLRLGYADTILS